MSEDINMAAGMLRSLLMVNQHGQAFVRVNADKWTPLPRWMNEHCKLALADADRQTMRRVREEIMEEFL